MEKKMSIELELQSISENVAKLPSSNPYVVPENYFELLATEVILKISPQEDCFSIPEGYFERQPIAILNSIHAEKRSVRASVVTLFRLTAAAVVVGILGWGLNIYLTSSSITVTPELSEAKRIIKENSFEKELDMISDNEAEHYLAASGHDVRTAIIASFSNNSDLPEIEDFLTDNLTLENYIESIGLTKSESNKN